MHTIQIQGHEIAYHSLTMGDLEKIYSKNGMHFMMVTEINYLQIAVTGQ